MRRHYVDPTRDSIDLYDEGATLANMGISKKKGWSITSADTSGVLHVTTGGNVSTYRYYTLEVTHEEHGTQTVWALDEVSQWSAFSAYDQMIETLETYVGAVC